MLWSHETTIIIVVLGVALLWTYRLITGRGPGDSGGDGGSFFDADGGGDGGDGGGH